MFFLDNCGGLGNVVALIKAVLTYGLIIIGIALIVLIIVDIAKSIIASEEKEVKEYRKTAIRRVIYFIAIFFVISLVTVVFKLVGEYGDFDPTVTGVSWIECWNDPQG